MTETPDDAAFWRRRLAAVVRDEATWRAELDERRGTIAAQAETIATQNGRLDAEARNRAALEAAREHLYGEIAALNEVVADREREIVRLFGEVSKAHRQLHEVWSSISWKATIPLRSVSSRLPGLARGLRGRATGNAGVPPPPETPAAPVPEPEPPAVPPAVERPADPPPPPPRNWTCAGDMDAVSPVAGDHVLFTSATPAAPDCDHLLALAGRGIGFSLVLDDVAPEPAAAWLRVALTQARGVFVPDAAVRDRILRWAVLSDVYVSAAVETGAPSDDAVARLVASGPVPPLAQPGRLFLPGIVAPELDPTLAAAQAWCTDDDPQVSILVVNRNTAPLTRACIQHVWAHTSGIRYEIVVADAGSVQGDWRGLSAMGRGVRLLPVGADRFLGEICNVVAERVRTPLLCVLGQDCFVQPGWLGPLVEALEADPAVGAAGPLLLAANAAAWEAGGTITEQGLRVPFGHDGEPDLQPRPVDYVSAAAFLVRRKTYLRAGGFDLMYEPELFEDVDLGFKLKALGLSVRSCPSAQIIQAKQDAPRAEALAELNRSKLVSRWGAFLHGRSEAELMAIGREVVITAPAPWTDDETLPAAALYTPYPITPGGGERFLLTMASELMRDHRVTLVTTHPYSQLRLQSLAHTFGIDLSRCGMQTSAAFAAGAAPDLQVVIGNQIYPPLVARTANAVFICQFPFPMVGHPPRIDQGYRAVIAYSEYARAHILDSMSAHDMPRWPIEIVYPPVPQLAADPALKRPIVLTVGRFFTGDHNKRHDLMIEAFRRMLDTVEGEVEMHLAGSSTPGPEHMRYLEELMRSAEGLPITFHVNASSDTLEDLYRRAAIYWHATGLGADLAKHPERAEHFGISLVEAMSAGCVPLAFDAAGPREIITRGVDGFLYGSIDELVTLTADLLRPDAAERRQVIGRAASERARTFSPERFGARVREVLLAG